MLGLRGELSAEVVSVGLRGELSAEVVFVGLHSELSAEVPRHETVGIGDCP